MSFAPGKDLVNGGVARGEALAGELYRQDATTSRTTNIRPTGTSPAWPRTPSCCTRVGLRLANCATGRTGAQDSEFRAARDAAPPSARALRARAGKHGERG